MDSSAQVGFCLDLKAVQTNLVLFFAGAFDKILQKFPCCGCLYFWGLTVTQLEFSLGVGHVFTCLIFFFYYLSKEVVLSLPHILLQALDQR